MKKILSLLLVCIIVSSYTWAQQFYFPKATITDIIAVDKAMTGLARNVIAQYKEDDQKVYLRNLFMLQIAAKEYANAIISIHNLRALYKPGETRFPELLAIQYEMFCNAKLKEAAGNFSLAEGFKQSFRTVYDNLNDNAALYISTAFITRNGVGELQQMLQTSLSNQSQKDSININDAIALIRTYNLVQVYKTIEPIAIVLLAEEDRKRYVIEDSVLIRTKDGAHISAIVVRRKGITDPQPAILQFSIYTGAISDITKDAVAHGYVGIIAFTRGKRFSPDNAVPYEYDGRDCYDVIEWISKQPWSNGKVGMYGGSYNGFTQWATAKHLHPALKTIVPSASAAPGLDVPMMNNVFENFVFSWIYYVTNNKFLDYADYNNTAQWDSLNAKWYAAGKPYRILDSLTGRGANKIFQSWIAHPSYDKYWQNMIPYKEEFSKINIPVLTTTGYYDGGQVGALYYFREHMKYNKNANHYLIIGPYSHFGSQGFVSIPNPEPVIGGYQIDPVANIPIHEIIFQWFDYILKGGKKPAILEDKINYQLMGSNQWQHKPSLDKMNNDTVRFYLSNILSEDHYLLNAQKPVKKEFVTETVDFSDRKTSNTFYHADTIIYNKLDKSNGLAFVSEPVKGSMSINGCFLGEIKASINKKDMDYNVTLYELTPDGKYFYLSYFMGRASYARDHSKRQLLTPGKIETIPFTNSYMTSKKISEGSRIVIVFSINKGQDNQINYGTGKDVSDESIEDAKTPLQIKLYNDSFIKIPVSK